MGEDFFQFITHIIVDAAIELSKLEEKLGPFKLTLLQFLNKVSMAFGSDIRTIFRDNDLYALLLDVFETYPLHDLALQEVTSIFSHLLTNTKAICEAEQQTNDELLIYLLVSTEFVSTLI